MSAGTASRARAPVHLLTGALNPLASHAQMEWLGESNEHRRAAAKPDFLAARAQDDGSAGAAASGCSNRGSFASADETADDRAASCGRADLDRVVTLGGRREAADGARLPCDKFPRHPVA